MISAFLLCLVLLLKAVDSVPTSKRNFLDLKASSCSINIQTAPNKKLEDVTLGMKRQLDEIEMKLENLIKKLDGENNTKR